MGTWIIGALVLGIVILAAHKVYKDGKSGKSCGCAGCSGCNCNNASSPLMKHYQPSFKGE